MHLEEAEADIDDTCGFGGCQNVQSHHTHVSKGREKVEEGGDGFFIKGEIAAVVEESRHDTTTMGRNHCTVHPQ